MKNFDELLAIAKKCVPKRVAVAVAQGAHVLAAVEAARQHGIAESILFGDEAKIRDLCRKEGINPDNFEIINEADDSEAAKQAVFAVSSGQADIVLKGQVPSPKVLKPALDRQQGLRGDRALSHVSIFQAPGYDRLVMFSDAGLNIMPNFEQKVDMIKNAVEVAGAFNIAMPKVAIIAGSEEVNPNVPSTVDAAMISKMADRKQITGCYVDGPLSVDLAISPASAREKQIESKVAGKADILIFQNIDAANTFYKTLGFLAGAKITGVIVGGKAPIIITSRADDYEKKLLSIAVSVLICNFNNPGGDSKIIPHSIRLPLSRKQAG